MLQKKILSLSNLSLFESETILSRKIISKRKKEIMSGDFQVICGSMVGENRRSPASTEIPALKKRLYCLRFYYTLKRGIPRTLFILSYSQF